MKKTIYVIAALLLIPLNFSYSQKSNKAANSEESETSIKLLKAAYLYGYPMLTMDYTHKSATNVAKDNGRGQAPINQWGNMTKFPKAGFTGVVRPNADTYYSLIYADLSKTPLYISIPATERYYLIPILNAFGNVIKSLGSRTTGQDDLQIAFVGPDYKGEIPDDLILIRSNTSLNWVLGRIAVKNNEDGKKEVINFQNKLISRPLSERNNTNYKTPKGKVDSSLHFIPMDAVDNLDITTYLNKMMALMVNNPPTKADQALMTKLKSIGIMPGGKFDINQFSKEQQTKIKEIPQVIQQQFAQMIAKPKTNLMQNGWMVNTSGLGEYGTNYALRAYVTKIGYGANTPEDAIYPNSAADINGNNYNGTNKYLMHFDADKLPPAKGFWSITLYNKKGFLVDNAIDRYNLGDQKDLIYNKDGSLDIYIQTEIPKEKGKNWLPAPQPGQEFELTFRIYWPKASVINRTWQMPGVKKIE